MTKKFKHKLHQIRENLDAFEQLGSGSGPRKRGHVDNTLVPPSTSVTVNEEGQEVQVIRTPTNALVQLKVRLLRNVVELVAQINANLYGAAALEEQGSRVSPPRNSPRELDERRSFLGIMRSDHVPKNEGADGGYIIIPTFHDDDEKESADGEEGDEDDDDDGYDDDNDDKDKDKDEHCEDNDDKDDNDEQKKDQDPATGGETGRAEQNEAN
jgi:hypothetical protein